MTESLQKDNKTKYESSAGGVVFKKDDDQIYILLSQHSFHHGWVFPKGLIGDKDEFKNQTKEETALREVKEETGAIGEILQALSPVQYWYVFQGQKIKKTVYYFIMKYLNGDITKHDFEMENVEWIKTNEVMEKLTYPGDKKVWEQARAIIDNF